MAASSSAVKPAIGILSIGDMGMGIAKLLRAHDYPVYTVAAGRRIKTAQITDLPSDEALVVECDIIFSIVPPRDAVGIATRVRDACKAIPKERQDKKGISELLFVDLNAVSPRTVKTVSNMLATSEPPTSPSVARRLSRTLSVKSTDTSVPPIGVQFLDGGIIGGPPQLQADKSWKRPSVVISGPKEHLFSDDLQSVLNVKIVSEHIGAASVLKACFASLNKGVHAIGIAAYTTAHAVGILPELRAHLHDSCPEVQTFVEKGITGMPPKAYRWVDEMKQIGETFADEAHLGRGHGGQAIFEGASEIYKVVADDTVLGEEKIGKRKRGTTVEDVAEAMRDGIETKRLQGTKKDEKLELAWRSSWA